MESSKLAKNSSLDKNVGQSVEFYSLTFISLDCWIILEKACLALKMALLLDTTVTIHVSGCGLVSHKAHMLLLSAWHSPIDAPLVFSANHRAKLQAGIFSTLQHDLNPFP